MKNKFMLENPKVSIVILNYNSYVDTIKIIENIQRTIDYTNYNIIVIDNASTNKSTEILREKEEELNFILIENSINGGYAAGNNIGIKHAYELGAKYTWIINNDIILSDREILKKLVHLMENENDIGALSPIIYNLDASEDCQYFFRPTIWDMTLGCLKYRKRRRNFKIKDSMIIYRPHGCCMILNNNIMNKIQYMDERTFLYCEEEILAERLQNFGYYCWVCKDTSVIHNHSKTVYSVLKKKDIVKHTLNSYSIYLTEYRNIKNSLLIRLIKFIKGIIIYISY